MKPSITGTVLLVAALLWPPMNSMSAWAASTFRIEPARRVVELTGYTRPYARIALVSEEEGACTEVALDRGDVVGKDRVFARLEQTFAVLELDRNRAEQGRVKSESSFYEKELERYRSLVTSEAAAQSALDGMQFRFEQAEQQLTALKVEEKTLKERLARRTIRAPAGWTVISREIEPGQWVARGQRVGEAGDFRSLKVPFALTIEELEALRSMGKTIQVAVPELSGSGQAVIETVSPDFDPQTRKVQVELKLHKGDFPFRGGLKATLKLTLAEAASVFLVPQSALLKVYEEDFLQRPDGARVRVVVIGGAEGGMVRAASDQISPWDEFLLQPGTGESRQ
jgi:membrane fusion protein, multidrug efflux system